MSHLLRLIICIFSIFTLAASAQEDSNGALEDTGANLQEVVVDARTKPHDDDDLKVQQISDIAIKDSDCVNISDALRSEPQLSVFLMSLFMVNLTSQIEDKRYVGATIFAPTNDAFTNLNHEVYTCLLKPANQFWLRKTIQSYMTHAVVEMVTPQEERTIRMLNDDPVRIEVVNGFIILDNTEVGSIYQGIPTCSGVVYMIDTINEKPLCKDAEPERTPQSKQLLDEGEDSGENDTIACKTVDEIAFMSPLFTIASSLLREGFEKNLQYPAESTYFLPTDAAFQKAPHEFLDFIKLDRNAPLLADLMYGHAISGSHDMQSFANETVEMVNHSYEVVSVSAGGVVRISGAVVTGGERICGGGFAHMIDSVLLPKALRG